MGSVGQGNYSAAKAGIAALTLVQSAEFARYGVTANAIAPAARTRMTEEVFAETMAAPAEGEFDAMAPENVSPLVVWLGSVDSAGVTGRVFEVEGGKISVADGWQHGPDVSTRAPVGARARSGRRPRLLASPVLRQSTAPDPNPLDACTGAGRYDRGGRPSRRGARRSWPCPGRRRRTWSRGRRSCRRPAGR